MARKKKIQRKTTKKVENKVEKKSVEERERKVDVNKLTVEQADQLSMQIGKEISKIMDEANTNCNKLLGIYGLQTKISYEIVKIDKEGVKS